MVCVEHLGRRRRKSAGRRRRRALGRRESPTRRFPNCALILTDESPFETSCSEARTIFEAFGAGIEGFPKFRMVAINIPPAASATEIKSALVRGESAGRWEYEESDITDGWPT
jgi:Domain of unknown function (DUF4265)